MSFVATAYAERGQTASGTTSKVGTVAADATILPLGSRIHIDAADYPSVNGIYVVTDTGALVKGRRIDIRVPSQAEAKRFGKRRVRVRILQLGKRE
jgi:3D (Asp-Asp-Asp) domain-containing protein